MRWRQGRRSKNVIDARGGGRTRGGQRAKLGGGVVILAVLAMLFLGQDMSSLLQTAGGPSVQQQAPRQNSAAEDEVIDFLSVVLADTEDTWGSIFANANSRYQQPELKIFSGSVRSACGVTGAAAGPFYCPGDNRLYMDLSFLSELQNMGAHGDFALAYVIAHEVGHHVQNLTGRAMDVQRAKQRASKVQANQLQVRMELEADCYAGVWAHHGQRQRQILEEGDVEEGLRAAAAVGDDHIQRKATGRVYPESFTHGTSEQRMRWFRRGLTNGDVNECNTFGG